MNAPHLPRLACAAAALALTLALTLAAAPAHAGRTVGVGLGSSTLSSGVSVKWQAKGGGGMQLVAGAYGNGLYYDGYGYTNSIGVSLDGLRDMGQIGNLGPIGVGWSLGGGGGIGVGGTLAVAAAGVAGLNFELEPVPLEFSIEYRPTLSILPGVYPDFVNASGHLRWWF